MTTHGKTLEDAVTEVRSRSTEVESGCWEWDGSRRKDGYGQVWWLGSMRTASRWAFVITGGSVSPDEVVRHTCDNPPCVNPDHLIPGTHADNRRDCAERKRAHNANSYKTHCKRGHEFTEENTRIRITNHGKGRQRCCRECDRIDHAEKRRAG